MKRAATTVVLATALSTPAVADPVITPIVLAAAAGALGVGIGAVTVGAAVLSVAATAIAAGVSYLMRPNAGSTVGRSAVPAQDRIAAPLNAQRAVPIAQPIPPRRFAYGPVRTGGAVFFQDNENPDLYIGSLLSDGVIESVDATYFGEESVPVDGAGLAASGSRFFGFFEREWDSGETTQAASVLLTTAFPLTTDSTFRQRGVARAVVRLDWGADAEEHNVLWGDSISPSFLIKGLKVYDPRDDEQDSDDPTTWVYSANPALCVAHAMTNAWGVAIATSDIDYDSVATAADVCDATISYNGDDVPIFRCAGLFQADVELGAQIADMLTSFRGSISFSGGQYSIIADSEKTSVWTIVDDDILELGEYVYATESRALFNAISATYYDASDNGTRNSTAPYELTAAVADEGLRETSLSLPFTPDTHSAQILAYRELIRSRDGRGLSVRLTDAALWLVPGEVVTLSTTYAAFLNGLFEVVQVDLADFGALVVLRGYDPDAYVDPADYLV